MSPNTPRTQPHHWTAFEHHVLLCLLCRQIQLTGTKTTSPSPITTTTFTTKTSSTRLAHGRVTKKSFKHSAAHAHAHAHAQQHHHADVADLLNRSLNYASHAKDIAAEEVSAMISLLMEERAGAVRFLERQGVGRVTRGVRRVWERAGVVARGRARDNGGGGGEGEDGGLGGLDSMVVDAQESDDEEDPWGDKVTGSSSLARVDDPWGYEGEFFNSNMLVCHVLTDHVGATSAANVQDANDPWGDDHVGASKANVQDATDPWDSAGSTLVNSASSDDPWASLASTESAAVNQTTPDDPWASLASTESAPINNTISDDPWADASTAIVNTTNSDFVSSQAEVMADITTAPNHPSEHEFTGINSERLAMFDASEEIENDTVQNSTYVSRGRGENAVELPFNRLAMLKSKETSEIEAPEMNQDVEMGEKE